MNKPITEGTITISLDDYISLLVDEERMRRLEANGVDNWNFYDDAMFPHDGPNMEDFEIDLRKRLSGK